jgi:superfamily II DNA helicase RecQ
MGMDFEHLTRTWLWQPPRSVLELAQSIGRVGRSNRPGKAIAYWDPWDFRLLVNRGSLSEHELKRMDQVRSVFESDLCRRLALGSQFNPTNESIPSFCKPPESPCDRCSRYYE